MTLRAAVWCAVSTRAQVDNDKDSLPKQEADARALCEQNGWSIVAVLIVPGHSRRYVDIHECASDMAAQGIDAFNRLLDLWMRRAFDVLVVRDGDRFARTQSLHAYVVERTIEVGARIYSLSDGWVDNRNYRIFTAMSGYHSAAHVDSLIKGRKNAIDKLARRGLPTASHILMSHQVLRDEKGRATRQVVKPELRRLWDDVAQLILEGVGWSIMERQLFERFGHADPDTGLAYYLYRIQRTVLHPVFWGHTAQNFNSPKNRGVFGPWMWEPGHDIPPGVTIYYHTHEPVYADELSARIRAELTRRNEIGQVTHPNRAYWFTGLFLCGECGYHLLGSDDGRYVHCFTPWRGWLRGDIDCSQHGMTSTAYLQTWFDKRLREAIAAGVLTFADESTGPTAPDRAAAIQADLESVESQVRRLVQKQAAADPALADIYDQELATLAERRKALRSALTDQERHQLATERRQRSRVIAFKELDDLTVDALWQLDARKINHLLHQLLGNRRIVVKDKQIIGMADAPRRTVPSRKQDKPTPPKF